MLLRFQSPDVEERWFVVLSLGCFFFFLFLFFCNQAFILFRYKKPHAALAMERTKPINYKQITKESHGTVKYPLSRRFFPSAGPLATYNKESTTKNLVV